MKAHLGLFCDSTQYGTVEKLKITAVNIVGFGITRPTQFLIDVIKDFISAVITMQGSSEVSDGQITHQRLIVNSQSGQSLQRKH